MTIGPIYWETPRRMLTWRFAASVSTDATTGVVSGPNPPATSIIQASFGCQAKIDVAINWATRPGETTQLRELVFYPRYANLYGSGAEVQDPRLGDRGKNLVVLDAAGSRVPAGGLVVSNAAGITDAFRPMKYQPREITPLLGPVAEQRTVATMLVDDRYELYRDQDPGVTYGQAQQFWYPMMGCVPSGVAVAADVQFFFEIGWIDTNDIEDAEDMFLDGDEMTILCTQGITSPDGR